MLRRRQSINSKISFSLFAVRAGSLGATAGMLKWTSRENSTQAADYFSDRRDATGDSLDPIDELNWIIAHIQDRLCTLQDAVDRSAFYLNSIKVFIAEWGALRGLDVWSRFPQDRDSFFLHHACALADILRRLEMAKEGEQVVALPGDDYQRGFWWSAIAFVSHLTVSFKLIKERRRLESEWESTCSKLKQTISEDIHRIGSISLRKMARKSCSNKAHLYNSVY